MGEFNMDVIEPLTTLVAAFAGAWAAFLFESRNRKQEEVARQKSAANQALVTLVNMWNIMFEYFEHVVRPTLGRDDAWLNMAATPPGHYGLCEFDAKDLVFLINVGEPQLFMELTLEEQRFWATMNLIQERNAVLLNTVHPSMSSANLPVNTEMDERKLISIIGIDATQRLKNFTPAISQQVEANCRSHIQAFQNLRTTMKRLYPETTFLSSEFKPLNGAA